MWIELLSCIQNGGHEFFHPCLCSWLLPLPNIARSSIVVIAIFTVLVGTVWESTVYLLTVLVPNPGALMSARLNPRLADTGLGVALYDRHSQQCWILCPASRFCLIDSANR
jgi:hypothetical protein